MSAYGRFINPQGYNNPKSHTVRRWFRFPKTWYDFTLDAVNPLTFWSPRYGFVRPDRHFKNDMGSVPVWLQWLCQKDEYLLSWLFHDSTCRHGGIYVCDTFKGKYTFRKLGREAGDELMCDMIAAEGGSRYKREIIHWFVDKFGRRSWERYRAQDPVDGSHPS